MKKLIVANWKMNPVSQKEAEDLFGAVKEGAGGLGDEIVVCPPNIFLPLLKGLPLGAQNCFYEEKGAFTGEISAQMLKDLGVEYVIIGHSERRKYFGETDEIVNRKIKAALEAGLKVIFCVGETQEQHDEGERNKVLERQIKKGLEGFYLSNSPNELSASTNPVPMLAIAYEPVWAIGTGKNCGVEETKEAINFIKNIVGQIARVLYGGSVKSENSGAYIKEAGADGLLVGGASLNAEEFLKIVKSAG